MSLPKFDCKWYEDYQITDCYIYYCDSECYLACPSCPKHTIVVGGTTWHVDCKLPVPKGKRVGAMATIKNEGLDGDVTFQVYDKTHDRVLGEQTKYLASGESAIFSDVFFDAEDDAEIWFRALTDIGAVYDEYGPMFIQILRPKFDNPEENCIVAAVKDTDLIAAAKPNESAEATEDCSFLGMADVTNPTDNTYKCGLQVWDWEKDQGIAWKEFTIEPGETKTVGTDEFSLDEGSYKFGLYLYVWEDDQWKLVDGIDNIYFTVKPAEQPPEEKPNPTFDYVKFVINGRTYNPPFEIEVDRGTEIYVEAKVTNNGADGDCFFKIWNINEYKYIYEDWRHIAKGSSETFSCTLVADKSLDLIVFTGYDEISTDQTQPATINVKGAPPPSPPTPVPPGLPVPTWALVAAGVAIVAIAALYDEERRRERLMLLLAARRRRYYGRS